MKLLLLNYEFPPVGGGASAASYNLAAQYARQGHSVDVLTCRAAGQPSVERIEGFTVYRVLSVRKSVHDVGLFGTLTYLCAAAFRLRSLLRTERYDSAQFFFALPTGVLSFLWRWETNAPYIVSLRGSDVPGYDADFKLLRYLHRVLLPVTGRILANAQHVVANSESLRELALESFPDVPISVTTNGVSETHFHPGNGDRSSKVTVTALCVARLIKRKGVHLLLEAVRRSALQNLQVKIVGVGPQEVTLRQLTLDLGLEGRVEFLGQKTSDALAECYRDADFLIHPASTESFSMTLLEAMASGLPIVATDVGGIPELVVPGENGLLFPRADVSALTQAIVDMSTDPNLRARLAGNNRDKIVARFTWGRIGRQYSRQCFSGAEAQAQSMQGAIPCD